MKKKEIERQRQGEKGREGRGERGREGIPVKSSLYARVWGHPHMHDQLLLVPPVLCPVRD